MASGSPQSAPSPTIFISYRREDASADAGRIRDWLLRQFGEERVFFDVDSIRPGSDFHRELESALHQSTVFLPVIGRQWLTATTENGRRRLDDPADFVRVEIASALNRSDLLLIPLLVQGADVPRADELPPDLQDLVKRQVCRISHEHFGSDMRRLIHVIEAIHPTARAEPVRPKPSEASPRVDPDDEAWRARMAAVELRRRRQLAEHVSRAEAALAAGDCDTAMAACEDAALIDLQDERVQALMSRTRQAIDEQQMRAWTADARRHIEAGNLAEASNAIDEALTRHPENTEALDLRHELLRVRRERERQRQLDELMRPTLDRARTRLDEGQVEEAIALVDEALAIDATYAEAVALRARAYALAEQRRREAEQSRLEPAPKPVEESPAKPTPGSVAKPAAEPAVKPEKKPLTRSEIVIGYLVVIGGVAGIGALIYFLAGPLRTAFLYVVHAYSSLVNALVDGFGGWLATTLPDSESTKSLIEGVTALLKSTLAKVFLLFGLFGVLEALRSKK